MHYSVRCGHRGLRPMPIVAHLCFMFKWSIEQTINVHRPYHQSRWCRVPVALITAADGICHLTSADVVFTQTGNLLWSLWGAVDKSTVRPWLLKLTPCNTDKTVAMVFPPKNCRLVVGNDFPLFRLGHEVIKYVSSFKYLGHVITQNCSDEEDIHREIRNLFNCTQTC